MIRRLVACLVAAAGCTAPRAGLDLASSELIDLTHAFNAQTIYWPTSTEQFRHDSLAWGDTPGGWFYSAFSLATPEHGGTHLDAPIHFGAGKQSAEAIPLERLIAPAVVIDVAGRADADFQLSAPDVVAWENDHGTIPRGSIVLLHTGWSRFWGNRREYLGDDTPGDASKLRFPSFGADAARLLIEERGIAAIGADVASIDHGASADFMVHRIAAAADVPGFENLTNLGRLPATGAYVIALPMKVEGGSGGPLRAVAIVPRR